MKPETKTCKLCGKEKFLHLDFYVGASNADGYLHTCKKCQGQKKTERIKAKKNQINPKTYDAEFEYLHISDRADYKALRSKVLGYLESVKQRRSRREIYAKMSKLRIVREALLHSYLGDILDAAVKDRTLVQTGSVLIPKWKFRTDADDEIKIFTPDEIKKIDYGKTNSQLFNHYPKQVTPFAENVYSKV